MKEIVVISGKGGAGKTVVASSFAVLFSERLRLTLADCDADAPNLGILLQPRVITREVVNGERKAKVSSACIECGECENVCRFGAIANFEVNKLKCVGCGACLLVCPANAITLESTENSELIVSETEYGYMVHGRLYPAAESSGGLVTMIRRTAERICGESQGDLLLIDGAPGIGCQVTASLTGADGAVIIVEPTEPGIHDAGRVIELCRFLGVPAFLCINKHDINPSGTRRVEELCEEFRIDFLGRIPYDDAVPLALSRGTIPIYQDCPASRSIYDIWTRLISRLFPESAPGAQDLTLIAVAIDGDRISEHFGRCSGFLFYEVKDGAIIKKEFVASPGHDNACTLPLSIARMRPSVVIAGGMGTRALETFSQSGIRVIIGASGDPDEAVRLFLEGKLSSSGEFCEH